MDAELKNYLAEQFKNVATKDDITGLRSELIMHVDRSIGEVRTDIADLGRIVNETIAVPLQRISEMLKDYPLIRGDVQRIKRHLGIL